jgi:glycosyltransferase involved in cell wall biosynthesis
MSVIVPAFNEEKLIERCLANVGQAAGTWTKHKWAWEVIVCDNNSADRTADLAKQSGARVVFEPINQISRARNRGASVAAGEWLVFIDADAAPNAALFHELASAIERRDVAGGGALVRLDSVAPVVRLAEGCWNALSRLMLWAAGSFVFCRADLFRELGGFSEELFASEEIDFSQRLKKLARRKELKVVILKDCFLESSGRKVEQRRFGEYLSLLCRLAISRGAVLRRREQLGIWYDGKR